MSAQKRMAEIRSYYSELSDDALAEAIQAGEGQYERDAWTVMCDLARSRGIPETAFAERPATESGDAGSAAQLEDSTGVELDEAVRQAKQQQALGAIILFVGILMTVASYSLAGP
ncbi:MAG TPA: hypothetical protein VF488_14295, partial [Gemmatimonadaceae bacterium]